LLVFQHLKVLRLSHNKISAIDGIKPGIHLCNTLQTLSLLSNCIARYEDLEQVLHLQSLVNFDFRNNLMPEEEEKKFCLTVIKTLPHLLYLNGIMLKGTVLAKLKPKPVKLEAPKEPVPTIPEKQMVQEEKTSVSTETSQQEPEPQPVQKPVLVDAETSTFEINQDFVVDEHHEIDEHETFMSDDDDSQDNDESQLHERSGISGISEIVDTSRIIDPDETVETVEVSHIAIPAVAPNFKTEELPLQNTETTATEQLLDPDVLKKLARIQDARKARKQQQIDKTVLQPQVVLPSIIGHISLGIEKEEQPLHEDTEPSPDVTTSVIAEKQVVTQDVLLVKPPQQHQIIPSPQQPLVPMPPPIRETATTEPVVVVSEKPAGTESAESQLQIVPVSEIHDKRSSSNRMKELAKERMSALLNQTLNK